MCACVCMCGRRIVKEKKEEKNQEKDEKAKISNGPAMVKLELLSSQYDYAFTHFG